MSDSPRAEIPRLVLERLSIKLPSGREILREAQLTVEGGEFVLLAGGSGSGKTTLLRRIAGLPPEEDAAIAYGGSVRFEDRAGGVRQPRVGLVFQNLALFEEFSARENVCFARDHAPPGVARDEVDPDRLLAELGVRPHAAPSALSGGERQRVAVARTLAQDPPILLFDEPTTGLDPARARDVADRLAEMHRRYGKTVVVVTHDYRPFLKHDPRLVLLDAGSRTLREVSADDLENLLESSAPPSTGATTPPDESRRSPRRLDGLRSPGALAVAMLLAFPAMLRGWGCGRWKARYLWHYLRMTMIGSTAVYILLSGAMLGFVFTSFTFAQLPFAEVTVPLLVEEFLAATGYATYRVVVPLMISVLLAGKCGAAIAADVGTRRLTHQFDALRIFGVSPEHYLYGTVALALLLASPLLTVLGFVSNRYAALLAFLLSREEGTAAVFKRNFMSTVWPVDHVLPVGTGWAVVKVMLSGLGIAAIAYLLGARRKTSAPEVSRDVSLTIFWATLIVLAIHSGFSFVEF